nr:MAG TPA: hypothetical protein [Caudoviricetes sp.]
MRQEELVGKKVLVKLSALPGEEQEQRVAEPIFDRFSIVEVVGYVSSNTYQVIIDGKGLGWKSSALNEADVITKKAETYWLVNLDSIVEVLK